MTGADDALIAAGMSVDEARRKAAMFDRCADALATGGTRTATAIRIYVPGRIEVLGKHTDYAGGRSILCAMERGLAFVAVARDDDVVRVTDCRRDETRQLSLHDASDVPTGDWAAYVSTVARRVGRDFPVVRRGADIAFSSDLPAASGMSSSSALVVGIFFVLHDVNLLGDDAAYRRVITSRETLGNYLGAVENGQPFGALRGDRGVGTLGGSQDQTAILCCRAGTLSRYAFCPARPEGEIPMPADRVFVVAYSGVSAPKTQDVMDRYNEASRAVGRILGIWNDHEKRRDGSLGDAVTSARDAATRLRWLLLRSSSSDFTAERLVARFDQFVMEAFEVIPSASAALANTDLSLFGGMVARSQRGAELLLGNQVPETIALVRLAHELSADAASAFGAGFGGSVWALVRTSGAATFAESWRRAYCAQFPMAGKASEFIVTRAGPAALRL